MNIKPRYHFTEDGLTSGVKTAAGRQRWRIIIDAGGKIKEINILNRVFCLPQYLPCLLLSVSILAALFLFTRLPPTSIYLLLRHSSISLVFSLSSSSYSVSVSPSLPAWLCINGHLRTGDKSNSSLHHHLISQLHLWVCVCVYMCVHETSRLVIWHMQLLVLSQGTFLRINVLLYPEGEQISHRHTVTEKERGERNRGREGLMMETVIDCPMVRIISERR